MSTWKKKLETISGLGPVIVQTRDGHTWQASPQVPMEVQPEPGILADVYGKGTSPAAAVHDLWHQLRRQPIIIHATDPAGRQVWRLTNEGWRKEQ